MALSIISYTIDTHYDEDATFIFRAVAEHFNCHVKINFSVDGSKAEAILIGLPCDILTVEKESEELGVDFRREEVE